MVLVMESTDEAVIHAFSTLAKELKVAIKIEDDDAFVSDAELNRRKKTIRKFKGGLKKYFLGYQPKKQD